MRKKSSTKKPTREELRRRLARDILSIARNPETPAILYDALVDFLNTVENEFDFNSPEYIAGAISAYAVREEKRKGGTR